MQVAGIAVMLLTMANYLAAHYGFNSMAIFFADPNTAQVFTSLLTAGGIMLSGIIHGLHRTPPPAPTLVEGATLNYEQITPAAQPPVTVNVHTQQAPTPPPAEPGPAV